MLLTTWMKKRREQQRKELSERGYNYAAGALLRGVSPEVLEQQADAIFDRNEFDAGITEALGDWDRATAPEIPGAHIAAMSLALEALEKERQAAAGRRDFSMLSLRAIEELNMVFTAPRG